MLEHLAELGVGGIFAILLLQTVLPYIKNRKDNGKTAAAVCTQAQERLTHVESQLTALADSTKQMAGILSQTDAEGAPLVYGSPGRLSAAINKLGATIEKLSIKIDHIG